MLLRSGYNLNRQIMPDEVVVHQLTQRSPQITKFCGRINGTCVDVESFLESLDNHINSSNITEDNKLNEAKGYLDLTKGDLKNFVQSWKFKNLRNYDEFKAYLRDLYGVVTQNDAVKSLSKMFRNFSLSEQCYEDFGGDAYQQINSWKNKLESSNWSNNGSITINNLAILLHQALTLAHLPLQLVEAIKENWDSTHDLATIRQRVVENIGKVPDVDLSHIIGTKAKQNGQIQIASVNSNVDNNQPKRKIFANNVNRSYSCLNCGRNNHYTQDCYARPYCTFHKITGHSLENCYTYNKINNQGRQSRSPNRNQFRGRSKSRNGGQYGRYNSRNTLATNTYTHRNTSQDFQQQRMSQNYQ